MRGGAGCTHDMRQRTQFCAHACANEEMHRVTEAKERGGVGHPSNATCVRAHTVGIHGDMSQHNNGSQRADKGTPDLQGGMQRGQCQALSLRRWADEHAHFAGVHVRQHQPTQVHADELHQV